MLTVTVGTKIKFSFLKGGSRMSSFVKVGTSCKNYEKQKYSFTGFISSYDVECGYACVRTGVQLLFRRVNAVLPIHIDIREFHRKLKKNCRRVGWDDCGKYNWQRRQTPDLIPAAAGRGIPGQLGQRNRHCNRPEFHFHERYGSDNANVKCERLCTV